jgi:hypothetical protein
MGVANVGKNFADLNRDIRATASQSKSIGIECNCARFPRQLISVMGKQGIARPTHGDYAGA